MIYGSTEPMYSFDDPNPPFYSANEEGTYLEADFFTAEKTEDSRIKINVQPNTTGKFRERIIEVWSLDIWGKVFFDQEAN